MSGQNISQHINFIPSLHSQAIKVQIQKEKPYQIQNPEPRNTKGPVVRVPMKVQPHGTLEKRTEFFPSLCGGNFFLIQPVSSLPFIISKIALLKIQRL